MANMYRNRLPPVDQLPICVQSMDHFWSVSFAIQFLLTKGYHKRVAARFELQVQEDFVAVDNNVQWSNEDWRPV